MKYFKDACDQTETIIEGRSITERCPLCGQKLLSDGEWKWCGNIGDVDEYHIRAACHFEPVLWRKDEKRAKHSNAYKRRDELIAIRAKGVTVDEAVEKYGCSADSCYRLGGFKRVTVKLEREMVLRIRRMLAEGKSIRQIRLATCVSKSRVWNIKSGKAYGSVV